MNNPCHPRKKLSEPQAKLVAVKLSLQSGKQKYAVPCGACKGWHVS